MFHKYHEHIRESSMNTKPTILLVEDNEGLGNFITVLLTSNDYNVIKTSKGKEAITMTASHCPDMVLLNMGLPDINGLEVLKAIRLWSKLPVIFVTADTNENDKVQAFDLGADDYMTKPFGTKELLARIRKEFRRSQPGAAESATKNIGDVFIDYGQRLVTVGGNKVHFTPIEYRLLLLFTRHAEKMLTYDFIIKEIWGPYTLETYESELQALRVNIANIRKKIEADPANPKYILTETGIGYRMTEN